MKGITSANAKRGKFMVKKKTVVDGDGIEIEKVTKEIGSNNTSGDNIGELLDIVDDLGVEANDENKGDEEMWNNALNIANLRILKKKLSTFRQSISVAQGSWTEKKRLDNAYNEAAEDFLVPKVD